MSEFVMCAGKRVEGAAKGTVVYRRRGTVISIDKEYIASVQFDHERGTRLVDVKELRVIRDRVWKPLPQDPTNDH